MGDSWADRMRRQPFDFDSAYGIDPIKSLWMAVITQAAYDACSTNTGNESRAARAKAQEWFQGNGQRFQEVCMMAGYDPDYIRSLALKAIAVGKPINKPAGQGPRYEELKRIREARKLKEDAHAAG